jgi:hypothetical protein
MREHGRKIARDDMAEGVVSGILGEKAGKPQIEAPEALADAEAITAAVAAIASRQDPQVAPDTSTFLNEQSRLLDIQAKHLEAEHSLRLSLLRGQRLGRIFRIGLQVFIALAVITMVIGFFAMLHEAVGATGVVIEAFQVPPISHSANWPIQWVAAVLLLVTEAVFIGSYKA